MTLTEPEQARYDAFIATVRGFDAYTVALALNSFTSGTDWRGSKRVRMAEAYAQAAGRFGNHALIRLDLDHLKRRLLAKKAGDYGWYRSK